MWWDQGELFGFQMCFSCSNDGNVGVWDLHNQNLVREFKAHADGVSCVDISADGLTLYTGGLDKLVNGWDIRQLQQTETYEFTSPVYALGCSPRRDWITVGLENSDVQMLHTSKPDKYELHLHDKSVLSLKFAPSGKWFVSTGKDKLWNCWAQRYAAGLFQVIQKYLKFQFNAFRLILSRPWQ